MTHLVFKPSLAQRGSCWGWGASVHKDRVRPLSNILLSCVPVISGSVCSFVCALCTRACEIDATIAISMSFAEDVFSPRLSTDDAL